jgi:hypothetical protein
MHLYFAGAESPSHYKTLRTEGVTRVAVNITALSRRVQDLSAWASEERLGGLEWILYADSPDTPWDAALTVLQAATDAGCPPDAIVGPISWGEDTFLKDSDLFFVPTWDGLDNAVLRYHLDTFAGTFLPDSTVDNTNAVRSASAASGPSSVIGAITGRSKGLDNFDVVISSAWWAVQKHGETQVWDKGKLHRYNSQDKLAKRQQHRAAIEALGVSADAVIADDPAATARLAIRSWLKLEENTKRPPVVVPTNLEADTVDIGVSPQGGSKVQRVASDRPEGRHLTLPVMGIEELEVTHQDADGRDVVVTSQTLAINTSSLRTCDNCSLSIQCPGYEAGSKCAYNIPVVIRSKDQLQGVLRATVEIQTQRVLMARFAEEITGTPDPDTGREIDRLFNMVQKWKEIEDNRDTLEVSVKARGEMGMLSRLFGAKVGANAMTLDTPISSESITSRMNG